MRILALSLLLTSAASAQVRYIELIPSVEEDAAASEVVLMLQGLIAQSRAWVSTTAGERMQVHLVAMDTEGCEGIAYAYQTGLSDGGPLILPGTQAVGTCPRNELVACARRIFNGLDPLYTDLQRLVREISERYGLEEPVSLPPPPPPPPEPIDYE